MDLIEVMHWIAQGVINIDYGHTTIEKDSKVYKAMVTLCEYMNTPETMPMFSRYFRELAADKTRFTK